MRQEPGDFFPVILERISHDQEIAAIERDRVPVDHIGLIIVLEPCDRLCPACCPSIGWWMEHCFGSPDAVIPFPDPFRWNNPIEQSFFGIYVVIFEVEALKPWITPSESLRFHKR